MNFQKKEETIWSFNPKIFKITLKKAQKLWLLFWICLHKNIWADSLGLKGKLGSNCKTALQKRAREWLKENKFENISRFKK